MIHVDTRFLLAFAVLSLGAAGCGGSSTSDAGLDAPVLLEDAGTDASVDAPPSDAPRDAGTDAPRMPVGDAVITVSDACPAFTPCGGDAIGTWTYDSICIDEAPLEALFAMQCPGTEILSGTGSANGVVTITATEVTRMIETEVTAQVQVGGATCIRICSAIPAVVEMMVPDATAVCTPGMDGSGNANCLCDVTFTSSLDESNGYEIQGGDTIVTSPGAMNERRFEYCIEGDGSLRYQEIDGEPGVSTSTMM